MQLHSAAASPFVRKVRVAIRELELESEVHEIDTTTSPMATDPALATANPLGKIPALLRDDGPALYDSRVICRYLNDRTQGLLYPEGRLWEVLTLEATADGIMEAAVLMVYEARFRPEPHRSTDWLEAQWAKITRALDVLGNRWMSHLSGRLDMGQIAVACALGYLDFRHPDRPWREGRGALDDWYAVFAERPAMAATRPPPA
ncbi:glutathione S-transferase [Rhodosalinus halophilus]|uniref:Glutathione S-transferase n=1 Tax=Rhodosalinus halophilus TaxID=2259333 RepID=A0A365UA94_9RHOB|nr:glutathione S-transferase [Rhodosalinus halophilus]RBI85963.1 glutathione S-transferase [Rhodosalinus halophilus]